MCCVFTALVFLVPRLLILRWWLIRPVYVNAGVDDKWLLAILAFIFLPWTGLMYLIVYPGGLLGFDWVWLGLGLLFDILSYSGGAYGNKDRLGY